MILLISTLSLLIFFLLDLSISAREVLKWLTNSGLVYFSWVHFSVTSSHSICSLSQSSPLPLPLTGLDRFFSVPRNTKAATPLLLFFFVFLTSLPSQASALPSKLVMAVGKIYIHDCLRIEKKGEMHTSLRTDSVGQLWH